MLIRFPQLRPRDLVEMPWYEFWFYLDWMLDEQKAAAEAQTFDPNAQWSGGHLGPDVAAGIGAQVREI